MQYTSQMVPGFSSRNSIFFLSVSVLRSLNESSSFQSSSHTHSTGACEAWITLMFHFHQLGLYFWGINFGT